MSEAVRAAFRQQAVWCRELGSPFTGLLCDVLAGHLDRSTEAGRRVLDWGGRPDARFEALPLRLAGGLHGLVRAGRVPDLAALYPPNPLPGAAALARGLRTALAHPDLPPWLESAPQTNEVARSAALMAGFMVLAARFGLPLALYELGASAGLNLVADRYAYRLGSVRTGAEGSPVLLTPEWRGGAPPDLPPVIVRRRGVDLNPLDATRLEHRERVMAYIWADQRARLARAAAAFELAAADPPVLDCGDAADWTEVRLGLEPEPGVVRVVMHSIAFQYFPAAAQARIADHLARVGALATQAGPLAWLRLEVDARVGHRPALLLTSWPGGREQVLATGSAHGLWVEWRG